MSANYKSKNTNGDSVVFDYIKGLLISIVFCLVMVVAFAFLMKFFNIPDSAIIPVTIAIKYFGSAIGAFFAIKGEKGLIKGIIFGLIYIVLSFFIFSAINGSMNPDLMTGLDAIASALIGGVVGILKVNKN